MLSYDEQQIVRSEEEGAAEVGVGRKKKKLKVMESGISKSCHLKMDHNQTFDAQLTTFSDQNLRTRLRRSTLK
jgi:ABC-type uncharacterized transport system ATPase subunit